jgi:hypothetical protein
MMANTRGLPGRSHREPGAGVGVIEPIAFGFVAFAAILLIAVSSVSFEGRTAQPTADGEAVPLHVVARDAG